MKTVATKVYGAADISADSKIRARFDELQKNLRALPGLHRQDAIFLLDRSDVCAARRAGTW